MILFNTSADLDKVREFYAEQGYRGEISLEDTILTVHAHKTDQILGVVRLCLDEGVLVLRGMQVVPSAQRVGLGTEMLKELCKYIDGRECWGIALDYLEKFYGKIDFQFVPDEQAPPHLQARMQKYKVHNEEVKNGKVNRIMFRAAMPKS